MTEQLKHRLVGAIVLVGAAVVVIPMVLRPPVDSARSIAPASVTLDSQSALGAAERASEVVGPTENVENMRSTDTRRLRRRADQRSGGLRSDGNDAEGGGIVDRERGVRAPQRAGGTTVRLNGAKAIERRPSAASLNAASATKKPPWAVQLGSFSERGNAVALRDRLLARGYQAFLRPTAERASGLTRVYVGPESSREQAHQLSRTLGRETRLNVLVVPYP